MDARRDLVPYRPTISPQGRQIAGPSTTASGRTAVRSEAPWRAVSHPSLTCRTWSSLFGMGVRKEKAQHLPSGIRSSGICVGSRRAATRPGMAQTVNDPLLEEHPPVRIGVSMTAVGMAARYATLLQLVGEGPGGEG